MSGHPTFKNPTILEAACEIRLRLESGAPWNPEWYGDYFRKLGEDYPKMVPKPLVQGTASIEPEGRTINIGKPAMRMLYKHKTRSNHILQLSDNLLLVSQLNKYEGWEKYLHDVKCAWTSLAAVIDEHSIERIGLRVINKIPKRSGEKTSEWLASSEYYPENILRMKNNYYLRYEHMKQKDLRVTVSIRVAEEENEVTPIMFDIDSICFSDFAGNWDLLSERLGSLHEANWEVFSSSFTPRYKSHLEGKC